MKVGMLWFDRDEGTLTSKVTRAANYYQSKYGEMPTLCFVHPSMMDNSQQVEGIKVRTVNTVLPKHFWLGDDPEN